MAIKIKASGGIIKEIGLVYHPIGNYTYLYNNNGAKGVAVAEYVVEKDKKGRKIKGWWEIEFAGDRFIFEDLPIKRTLNMIELDEDEIKAGLEREYNEVDEIYKKIKSALELCFDFSNQIEVDLCTIFILQTWFEDLLNSVLYLSISSKMGSGKTSLLEILKTLSRNGLLANDVSFASIPRLIEKYKANIFIDELDMVPNKERGEIFKILRQGYRKGQYYVRLKPKTFEEEFFNVYGSKAFTFRGDIVDDLKARSITISTPLSSDKKMPLINYFKEEVLIPLHKELIFFYLDYALKILKKLKVNEVNKNNGVIVNILNPIDMGVDLHTKRSSFLVGIGRIFGVFINSVNLLNGKVVTEEENSRDYKELEQELEKFMERYFTGLTGRNIELFFNIIILCKLLDLDIADWFKGIFDSKEEFEKYDEPDFKALLREVLVEMYKEALEKDGIKFHKHRNVAKNFNKRCFEEFGIKPSSRELKKQLKELGFIDKVNRKVMKVDGVSTLCLIYDNYAKKLLGIEEDENTT